jgi:hypothetical protein
MSDTESRSDANASRAPARANHLSDGCSSDPLTALLVSADRTAARCAEMIDRLDDAVYIADSRRFSGSSIGKHVRHTLDHFSLLLVGHARGDPIRYDHRSRGVPVERERAAATEAIEHVRRLIGSLTPSHLRESITIRVMPDASGAELDIRSTLARELAFASHHAVHHFAIMKSIAEEHGFSFPDDYAQAPSTISHERARH